jgi:SHS family lactate transporter-like MFS transporter
LIVLTPDHNLISAHLATLPYLLIAVQKSSQSWRILFFIGAGLSAGAALFRAVLPESQMFLDAREAEKSNPNPEQHKNKAFMRELGIMLKTNWLKCILAVLLMTGVYSFSSVDLVPATLTQALLTPRRLQLPFAR